MESAMIVGQVTIDSYYDSDDNWIASLPGGTALNAGMWMDSHGFDTTIAATLGSDFPVLNSLDFHPSEQIDEDCPVSYINLKDNGREEVEHRKGDYSLEELNHSGDYDLIYMTSGFEEYSDPFLNSNASMKGFSPGPEPENLDLGVVKRCLEEADHVTMNDREKDILNERMNADITQLPEEYGLDSLVVTSADSVVSYSSAGAEAYGVEKEDNPEDTIGAGDAFSSIYLVSRYEGLDEQEAIQNAMRTSNEIINQTGGLPNQPVI
jgi:sugar/nucleoside kinase (ribokinase family)